MNIILSNQVDKPIYEQIIDEIKHNILNGNLESGALLPSIRSLAKDLKISNITTKRAYDELEKQGFIETVPGKDCFVKQMNPSFLQEEIYTKVENYLCHALQIAKQYHISKEQVLSILEVLYEEENL